MNLPAIPPLQAVPPFSGTDMAAFVVGVLATLYGVLWLRDREPGMRWLCASFAMLAVYSGFDHLHVPTGPYVSAPGWSALALLALMFMAVGLVEYFGIATRERRWVLPLLLLPGTALLIALALGLPVLRAPANLAGTVLFVGASMLAFGTARREPGAGHGAIGLALLAVPGAVVAAMLLDVDTTVIRFWAAPPLVLLGLTLLTASLLRRRRALEREVARRTQAESALTRLNATLEESVARRTADLQSMVAGLESFNRTVSHDLRGPLGGIAGLARMAEASLAQGDVELARQVLPQIAGQAESSTQLVSALLELARVGDASLQRRPVPLGRVVQEALGQLALAHPQGPVNAVVVQDLPVVDADSDILRPVFVNLIGNALKFVTGRLEPHIEIGALRAEREVTVFVRDNGVGFETSQARSLFEPFVRLHGQRFEGNGVGLSIVRRAIERHGGRVWAEATPGQGACFFFTLPAG